MTMREKIEFLKRDRRVNDTFLNKLVSVGFEIEYGPYDLWDWEPYLQIGKEKVWLVEGFYPRQNTYSLRYRYQNEVLEEINEMLDLEIKKLNEEEYKMKKFFEEHKKQED